MVSKLILGCGQNHPEIPGEVRVDKRKFQNVDVVHDLNEYPWPFKSDQWDGIFAQHLIEHLETRLLPFMDECWRILRPGGSLYIETPYAGSSNALEWDDPTHVRCYTKYSFVNYFSLEGVARFGYTHRAWNLFLCEERLSDHVLVVHAYPLKQ